MSDTTPTPDADDATPLTEQTARQPGAEEQPVTAGADPADHTDTTEAPTLPPAYRPVSAADHVAPEPDVPAAAASPVEERIAEPAEEPVEEPADALTQPEAPVRSEEPAQSEVPAQLGEAEQPGQAVLAETAPSAVAEEPAGTTPVVATVPAPVTSTPAPAPVQETVQEPVVAPYPAPTYLRSSAPPKKKGNRGIGILIAVLGVVVFAVLDAAVSYAILLVRYGETDAQNYLVSYLQNWEFWVPLAVFAGAFIALVAIVNRGRWWGYVLGSAFVAALVFAGYFGAALLTNRIWEYTPDEFRTFVGDYFDAKVPIPYLWIAIAVTFVALEVVVWLGAWIAARGQSVKRRNAEAKAAFEEEYGPASVR